jgi:polyisoprenoid-binding protein YceI
MRKLTLTIATIVTSLSVFATPPGKNADKLKVNTTESKVNWLAKKVTGQHEGYVKIKAGEITVEQNKLVGGTVIVDMTTLDATDLQGEYHDKLVGHLKSNDFFGTETFNSAILVIKSATPIANAKVGENNYTIVADLTIKGITKEVTFPAVVIIDKSKVTANAEVKINRTLYDIKYGSASFFEGIGDKAIDDTFKLNVSIVAQK